MKRNTNTLAAYKGVPTYENTKFDKWWKMLNQECVKRGVPEQTFREARDAYEMGETPETAACWLEGQN